MSVEIRVHTVRSILAPRWWQIRRRFRQWRFERDAVEFMSDVPVDLQRQIAAAEDRAFLFGTDER